MERKRIICKSLLIVTTMRETIIMGLNNKERIIMGLNNNNNNLFLRSPPRETPNWCMRLPCLWDKGPPFVQQFNC